ncbi:protein-export chaperone SecB, partial [Gammaproteobacteria bacterium]|nr:protein-export chaperone SecB [Gammaproteobacteria bacterium]
LANTHDKIGDNSYDVSLTIKAEATYGEKTMFIAEVEQSGVFVLNGYDDEEIKDLIAVYCPSTLFPYVRETLSSLVSKGGFPALNLQPISFEALYAQAKDEQQTKN